MILQCLHFNYNGDLDQCVEFLLKVSTKFSMIFVSKWDRHTRHSNIKICKIKFFKRSFKLIIILNKDHAKDCAKVNANFKQEYQPWIPNKSSIWMVQICTVFKTVLFLMSSEFLTNLFGIRMIDHPNTRHCDPVFRWLL